MPKRIELTIVDDDITATAELLEEEAPLTCAAIWRALETPMVEKGIQAMWTGREIMVEMPQKINVSTHSPCHRKTPRYIRRRAT